MLLSVCHQPFLTQCTKIIQNDAIYAGKTSHCTWQVVLPEKFCAKQMVLKNVIRTYWSMQKSKMQNHIMCPLRGLVQHRPKNPPNLGRMGCLCQLLSPKGHMIWFLFFHYTFPVAKWVRKYPPCALHKTFLVRCLRKYSDMHWTFHSKEYSTRYSLVQFKILREKEVDMSQINFIDSVDLAQIPQPTILL